MSTAGILLVGLGIIFFILGVYLIIAHYRRPASNTDYLWLGEGEHPFKKE